MGCIPIEWRSTLGKEEWGSVVVLGVIAPARVMKTLRSSCGVENLWLTFHRNRAKVLEPPPVQAAQIHDFSRRWGGGADSAPP